MTFDEITVWFNTLEKENKARKAHVDSLQQRGSLQRLLGFLGGRLTIREATCRSPKKVDEDG